MKISDLSIQRPVFASMMALALVLFGVLGYQQLEVRELPDVDPPIISVRTTLRGANPGVMESSVTDVLEEELSTLAGLRTLTSSSAEQSSTITLEFNLDRDVESAAQDVRDKVSRVRGKLPKDVEEPIIAKQDADAQAFMYLSLSSPAMDLMQLSDLADRVVKQQLQTVDGVGSVNILGQRQYSMRVWLDPEAMAARGLTVQDVSSAILAHNVEVPAGRIESAEREFTVRSMGQLATPREFSEMVIASTNGIPVKLQDIARVELAPSDTRSAVRYDGTPSVGLGVIRQSKANLLEVADGIRRALPALQATLPPGAVLTVSFDQSIFVRRSIDDAERTLVEAAILVVIIIFLFLRNLRATLIPAFAIPTSIIAVFAVMQFFGFSVNSFTLLALTIAIGIVVDDAIIVLENAYRHQEELHEPPMEAARRGTSEIGFAVIATTISLMAVFVPLAFLHGDTGRLFREFGIAVAGSVLISGFIALTLTPMLCARILRVPPRHGTLYRALERGFDGLAHGYHRVLGRALRHPLLVLAVTGGLLALAGVTYRSLKREFIPADDRGVIFVNSLAPEGATIEYTDRYQHRVEAVFSKMPEVEHVFSGVGFFGSPNSAFMVALLKPWEERRRSADQLLRVARPELGTISGVMAFASSPQAIGGRGSPVNFIVRHANYDSLLAANVRMLAAARAIPGLLNVDTDLKINKPELRVSFDRDRADDLGVPVASVAATLQTMLGGSRAGTFTRDNKLYDVLLQLDPSRRASPQDMSSLFMRGRDGSLVRLDALTKVEESTGPRSISHFGRVRSFTLSAAIAPGYTLGEAIDTLAGVVRDRLPTGTTYALSGESRELAESGNALLFAFGLAVLVVFMVLASQFESLVHPITVLVAVPLAVLGAIFTLKLVGATINLYSQIGMILLVGLVTKNSILLVDAANKLRETGHETLAAILEAGRIRLRPILMTSVATIMGALPVALGIGAGSASRRPLGYAIVGGMVFSTALTLFVVPVVWLLLARLTAPRAAVEVPALAAEEGR